jgi:DNA-directed RNA polymerase specialized sigma24 family protein
MHEMPDPQVAEWLRQAASGEREAKDQLVTYFGVRLRTMTKRMLKRYPGVKRWQDTNDVYQNAMMRLLKALGKS